LLTASLFALQVLNGADAARLVAGVPGLGPRTAAKIKAAWAHLVLHPCLSLEFLIYSNSP
jgi:hypothetical protein